MERGSLPCNFIGCESAILIMKEFLIIYRYSSVAILVASEMFRQSMSQNLADTVVVNETQSLTKVKGVDPVTSSH